MKASHLFFRKRLVDAFFMEKFMNNLTKYQQGKRQKNFLIIIFLIILLLLTFLEIAIGPTSLKLINVIKALFLQGDKANIRVIWALRMPRILAAILAGAGLALAGMVMQSLLQNPMASPTTLGVNNGAVFGANLAIIVLGCGAISTTQGININLNNPYLTTICAFVFAMLSTFIILLLSKRHQFASSVIVLSGVALGALFNANTTILQYFADDTSLSSAVFWTFGDLSYATYLEDLIMFLVILISFIYFLIKSYAYNALISGDDIATSLGINVKRTRFMGLFLASLICAVCVSFLGIIGFVGLVAPHIAKKIVGLDHRHLVICSCLTGSIMLLMADFLSRILIKGVILPIGAITSIFGAPLFLFLIIKKKRGKNA